MRIIRFFCLKQFSLFFNTLRLLNYGLNKLNLQYLFYLQMSGMTDDCFNCRLPFDDFEHKPMILCKGQHYCCEECALRLLGQEPARCPLCVTAISRTGVVNFRQYYGWLKEGKHTKALLKKEQTKAGLLPDLTQTLSRVLNIRSSNQEEFYPHDKLMAIAESLFEEGKNYAAIALLKGLIERQPNFQKEKFIGLGSKEENIGFSEGKPLSWFKERQQITNISAEDLLSHILMLCPEYDETEWLSTMTLRYPQNFKFHYASALNKHNKKIFQGALVDYKRVIELNPCFGKAYCMLAFIQKNQAQALNFANMCLERQPGNLLAKYFLALKRKRQERLTSLRQIFEEQPEYLRAKKKIGDIHFNRQQYEQALQNFSICMRNEYYLVPFICIARCKFKLGRRQQAVEQLQRLSENERFVTEKSQIMFLIGKYTDNQQMSKIHLKQSFELDPTNQEAIIKLAQVYSELNKHQYALSCYQKALSLHERSPNILASICQCYLNSNKPQERITYLKRWKEIEPQNTQIDLKLGQTYFQQGNWQSSLQHFLVCTIEGPYNAEINMKIIDIYQRLGDFERVLRLLGQHLHLAELSTEEYDNVTQRIRDMNRQRTKQINQGPAQRQPKSK